MSFHFAKFLLEKNKLSDNFVEDFVKYCKTIMKEVNYKNRIICF